MVARSTCNDDRSRVPTACRQARKQCVLGRLVVEVEGLRIELTGESFDLLLINDMGSARKALTDVEIVEIEPIVVAEFLHGQFLSSAGSVVGVVSTGFLCDL